MSEPSETGGAPLVKILGTPGSARAYTLRDFLHRSDVPFEWVPITNDEQACAQARVDNLLDPRLPVCVFPDGTRMECPTIRQITEKSGWFRSPSRTEYDLAIYGAGASEAPLTRTEVTALDGDQILQGITLTHNDTGRQEKASPHWLFVCTGGVLHTQWATEVGMLCDGGGIRQSLSGGWIKPAA